MGQIFSYRSRPFLAVAVAGFVIVCALGYMLLPGGRLSAQVACTRTAPTVVTTPSEMTVLAGTQVLYNIKITNNDTSSCTNSIFSLSGTTPSGWSSASFSPASNTIAPGASYTFSLYVSSNSGALAGTSTIPIAIKDSTNSIHNTNISVKYGIPPPRFVLQPGEMKMLVMLINYTDNTAQPLTTGAVYKTYFSTTSPSVNLFYKENSNNKVFLTGDVIGYYTIDREGVNPCGNVEWSFAPKAKAMAEAAGVNTSGYNYYVYLVPYNSSCGYSGYAYYGYAGGPIPPSGSLITVINGYNNFFPQSHELGHNLGVAHGEAMTCPNAQMVANYLSACTQESYGDYSDVMGNNWTGPTQFNVPHQIAMGWINPASVQTVSTNGTYTINSLETKSGLLALKIAKPDTSESYYVSLRQPIGYDAAIRAGYLGGINVHTWDGGATSYTRIISLNGIYAGGGGGNYAMQDGASFFDPVNKVTIRQESHTASTASVSVTFGTVSCASSSPTLTLNPSSMSGVAGSGVNVTMTVKNNDAPECNTSIFIPKATLPSGWSGPVTPASISLAPGKTGTFTYTITSSASAAANTYFATTSVSDATNLAHTAAVALPYTISSAACNRIAPTISATPASYSGNPGATTTFSLLITHRDTGCSASTYTLASTTPSSSGWKSAINSPSNSFALSLPGSTRSFVFTLISASNAPSATTSVAVSLSEASVPEHSVGTSVDYFVKPVAGICSHVAPTVTLTPLSATATAAGDIKQYNISVKNNDTAACTPSTFVTAATLPASWSGAFSASPVVLSPAATQSTTLSVTSPSTAPGGTTLIPISITDASASEHNTSVTAAYGIPLVCTRTNPLVSISPSTNTAVAGSRLSYVVNINNRDTSSCGSSVFDLSSITPSGWNGLVAPGSVTISPGLSSYADFSVTSSAGASVNTYQLKINVDDTATASHAGSAVTDYVVGTPVSPTGLPSANSLFLSASRVHAGGSSTLTWWVSSGLTTGVTCAVSPGSSIKSGPTSINGSDTVTSWGSSASPITAQTIPISAPTIFTLSCTNGASAPVSASTVVTLVPTVQEI
jgi:uncharacterized membrane protein